MTDPPAPSTGLTSSKNSSGSSGNSKARTPSPCSTTGSPGARRCRIPEFVELYHRIAKHRATIDATLIHGLSNALVESTSTKIRVVTRMAYGFKKPEER